jgi:hypothetical protein
LTTCANIGAKAKEELELNEMPFRCIEKMGQRKGRSVRKNKQACQTSLVLTPQKEPNVVIK